MQNDGRKGGGKADQYRKDKRRFVTDELYGYTV